MTAQGMAEISRWVIWVTYMERESIPCAATSSNHLREAKGCGPYAGIRATARRWFLTGNGCQHSRCPPGLYSVRSRVSRHPVASPRCVCEQCATPSRISPIADLRLAQVVYWKSHAQNANRLGKHVFRIICSKRVAEIEVLTTTIGDRFTISRVANHYR